MITSWETIGIRGDKVTADLIIWRRYRRQAPGILEAMLDANPDLARAHRYGPFLPIGLVIQVPIDGDIIRGAPAYGQAISLYPPGIT